MSQADIADLQAVGRDAQAARREFILKDDQHAVWDYIRTLKNSRVDFVLDNAGFEVCPASKYRILFRATHLFAYLAFHRLRFCRLPSNLYALRIEGRIPVSMFQ